MNQTRPVATRALLVAARSHACGPASLNSNEIRAHGGGPRLPLCVSQQTGTIPMQISSSTHGDIRILAVSGRIDLYSAGSFYDALVEAVGDAHADLVIDLSGVVRLTSAGMGGLVVAAKLQQAAGHAIRLCGMSSTIKKFLSGRGHDHLLRFEPTLENAIQVLSPAHGEGEAAEVQGMDGARTSSAPKSDNVDAEVAIDQTMQALPREDAQVFIHFGRLAPEGDGTDPRQTDYPAAARNLTGA
ncbi:STAS domain-containing protein [Hoeflea sp.]|uniref:STAS domain-containing protein n=1 Tax=Hoeflea sp. TaxID=1940281 RepID=UPI003A948ABD